MTSPDGEFPVEVTTLDELARSRGDIDFLKADLEGSELDFLEGGRELIARCKPRIAITTYHRLDHAEKIKSLLTELYRGYKFRLNGLSQSGAPILLHAWPE